MQNNLTGFLFEIFNFILILFFIFFSLISYGIFATRNKIDL